MLTAVSYRWFIGGHTELSCVDAVMQRFHTPLAGEAGRAEFIGDVAYSTVLKCLWVSQSAYGFIEADQIWSA